MLDTIKKIIGRFWFQIFNDQWLITGLLKLYQKLMIPRLQALQYNLKSRLNLSSLNLQPYYQYRQILIQTKVDYAKKRLYDVKGQTLAQNLHLNMSDQTNLCFTVFGDLKDCVMLTDNICRDKAVKLQIHKDFQVIDNKLYMSKKTFDRLSCQTKLLKLDGLKNCYRLWGIIPKIDLSDKCCGILGFPISWLIKYPQVVRLGFDTHFNGLSKKAASIMLNAVLDNPICCKPGYIQRIQQVQGRYFVTISGITYSSYRVPKCYKQNIDITTKYIEQGDYIFEGQNVQIITWKDSTRLTSDVVPGISIATQAGPILLRNRQFPIQAQNVLPGTGNVKYQELCKNAQNRPYVAIGAIGSIINPLQYVISKLWKKRFILIKMPVFNKGSDLDIVLRFILRNIPKSCIVIVQPILQTTSICSLDLQCSSEVIQYYVNNHVYQLEVEFENI